MAVFVPCDQQLQKAYCLCVCDKLNEELRIYGAASMEKGSTDIWHIKVDNGQISTEW